ncbi:hypothetical protein E2C01_012948 [Portunus trituberculatus]|uniref:Uncharacterized protein n=1 Tax=Portunus trituberculatus TaxID=210409 RepID=A0A5B7DFD0_PORTR|nr:hypothetical protein [Portunus trituberculatus]
MWFVYCPGVGRVWRRGAVVRCVMLRCCVVRPVIYVFNGEGERGAALVTPQPVCRNPPAQAS